MEQNELIRAEGREALIRPGEEYSFTASVKNCQKDKRYSLYFTGESKIGMLWRTEPDYEHLYMILDDSLNSKEAHASRYCLDFSTERPIDYVKRAMKKFKWPPAIFDVSTEAYSDDWDCGIYVKTRNLKVEKGGFVHILIERWNRREGVDPIFTGAAPDEVTVLDVKEGSADWYRLGEMIRIPKGTTACLLYSVEGYGYSGELYFECPFMISAGYNVVPDFGTSVQNQKHLEWFGCNLHKKDWPELTVRVNGTAIHEGEIFEACHLYSNFELDIPQGVLKEGENTFSFRLTSHYHDPAPFALNEVRIVERPGGKFAVITHAENAVFGGILPILVRTSEPNVRATFTCPGGELTGEAEYRFAEAGLHTVTLHVNAAKNDIPFAFSCGEQVYECVLRHVCQRGEDGVVTGSSDTIQINFDTKTNAERFLEWYFSNQAGNLMAIRPAYRWGGTRTLNREVWKSVTDTLNGMDVAYSCISDGRDVPEMHLNPSPDMMQGKKFLGMQIHERDGQLGYWGDNPEENFVTAEEFYDLVLKLSREYPDTMYIPYNAKNFKVVKGKITMQKNLSLEPDYETYCELFKNELKNIKQFSTRHTGPTVWFKYFFDAGFDWTGAETMYGMTEPLLAFQRGASKAVGQKSYGIHAALQWSTRPHDTPERYRRYRLALYIPYICGATEINTEEGIIRLECGFRAFNQYSEPCRAHLKQQQDFYRYVSSHTRSGSAYSPIALLHGRYDGWEGFSSVTKIWGMPQARNSEAENAWNAMGVFFPQAAINRPLHKSQYCFNEPLGTYTTTPYGNVDVLPVEKPTYDGYSVLAFMGYNKAEEADMKALEAFMRRGGKLIACLPHFSDTTNVAEVQAYRHHFGKNALLDLIGGAPEFEADTVNGKPVHVAKLKVAGEILKKTDNGLPLIVRIPVGKGCMILCNTLEYAGNEALREIYEELLRNATEEAIAAEPAWLSGTDGTEFSVYDGQKDGTRHFYLLAMDWYREPSILRHAELRLGKERYDVTLPFGVLLKIVATGDVAVWAESEDGEVLSVFGNSAKVQGYGTVTFCIAKNGKITRRTVDFSTASETVLPLDQ